MSKRISGSQVKAIFTEHYNGSKNLMTPDVVSHGILPRYLDRSLIWELSTGEGFSREPIFGVTVLEVNGANYVTKNHHDLSRGGFKTAEAAKAYIKTLRRAEMGEL